MKEKNKSDYSSLLNKIVYCLYIVIALLILNSILLTVSIGTKGTKTSTNDSEQEELPYDVSEFTEMTTDQAMAAIEAGGIQVFYIGHSSCGFCRRYVPVLQEAQKAYGFKTLYIDTDKLTSADVEKWSALDDYVKESFGYTPLTVITKDGQYLDGQLGYMDYNSLKALLEKNGFQAK